MSSADIGRQLHQHRGTDCPVSGKHGFCPSQPGDSRSPCPALNTMANHGYINRDGKQVSAYQIYSGLKACYGLSTCLALFVTYVGFAMLKCVRAIDLFEIGKHNVIEHNASLVHHDTPHDQEFAPVQVDQGLVDKLINDVEHEKGSDGYVEAGENLMDAVDVARSRIRRESECGPVNSMHAEIARGEMAIILGVWETTSKSKVGVPVAWMQRWIGQEQLPDGWRPTRTQGLWNTIQRSRKMRKTMEEMRETEGLRGASQTSTWTTLDEKASFRTSTETGRAKL